MDSHLPDYQAQLEQLSQKASLLFDEKEKARETAFAVHRQVIKLCGNSIKSMHRGEFEKADSCLEKAKEAFQSLSCVQSLHSDIFYGGFIQSAQKEYAEARCYQAIVLSKPIPSMEELQIDLAPYLNGLGEAIGELRRYIMDHLRQGDFTRIEEFLKIMDEIYFVLNAVDYPDALTLGLRRTCDIARSLVEKTRGDLTNALQQKRLEEALQNHRG
jgi:translin